MDQDSKIKPGENIVFYDGICALCDKLVQFVIANGGGNNFLFCPLQSKIAEELLSSYKTSAADRKSVIVISQYGLSSSKLLKKSQAVFFILQNCCLPPYILAGLSILRLLPVSFWNIVYDLVARFRYKIFGRYEKCFVHNEMAEARFITD